MLAREAPSTAEFVPVTQSVHVAVPVTVLYFPPAHAVHVPPSGPVCPDAHLQSAGASLAVVLIELLGQLEHELSVTAPVDAEYLPAPQFVHVLATEAPVLVEYLPAPQLVQVEATEAPESIEYLPASQFAQKSLFNVDFTRIITIPEPPFPPQHEVQL